MTVEVLDVLDVLLPLIVLAFVALLGGVQTPLGNILLCWRQLRGLRLFGRDGRRG